MAYGINAPFGLRPLNSLNGGTWVDKLNVYYIAATQDGLTTYATPIFTGDPVIWNPVAANQGGGTIARYKFNTDGTHNDNKVPVLGVFTGCEYYDVKNRHVKANYWPGGVQIRPGSMIKAWILDDPSIIYDIQVSTWTNVLNDARFTRDLVGQNFGFGLGGGGVTLVPNNPTDGNVRMGQSGVYLAGKFTANESVDLHKVATLPLKVMGYSTHTLNLSPPKSYTADATTAPFLNVRVIINNHVYRAGTGGIVAVQLFEKGVSVKEQKPTLKDDKVLTDEESSK